MKIYCIVVHGVEDKEISDNFAVGFINGIQENLKSDKVFFSSYNWSHLVHDRQMQAFEAMSKGLGWEKFRKLKHTIGSDLLWYNRTKSSKSGDMFRKIHDGLDCKINDMIFAHGSPEPFKIVLIGHSLGSQICLGHCFESVHKNIIGLISMGSPIGMYSGMFDDWGHLPDCLKNIGTFWMNFWNKYDVVSSPLENHPSEEIGLFVEDRRVETWNPLNCAMLRAHSVYWDHSGVHKAIAAKLDSFLL